MESGRSRKCEQAAQSFDSTPIKNQELLLRRAARFNGPCRGNANLRQGAGVGGVEADENLVRGVLQPSGRFVQLPGSFARQLAELVTVGHVRECPKDQIRTHKVNLLPGLFAGTTWCPRYGDWLDIICCPKQPVLPFRRTK